VSAASASAAVVAQAATAAELEAAHKRVESALQSEVEVMRQRVAAKDQQQQQLEGEVKELQAQVRGKREQLEAVIAAGQEKEKENAKLWEQVKAVSGAGCGALAAFCARSQVAVLVSEAQSGLNYSAAAGSLQSPCPPPSLAAAACSTPRITSGSLQPRMRPWQLCRPRWQPPLLGCGRRQTR
jgi:septal ring factor EnvC (AmiA/AmiB activator)